MNQAYKDFLIEKFLQGTLTEQETQQFQFLWKQDSEFVEEAQDRARLKLALETLSELKKEEKESEKPSLVVLFRRYRTLAAACVLLLLAWPAYLLFQPPNLQKLADDYFISKRLEIASRDRDFTESMINKSQQAYQKGQIQEAIAQVKQAEMQENKNYAFFIGDLYFKQQQADSAIVYYRKGLLSDPNDPYVQWNLMMAYLLKDEKQKVIKDLKELLDTKNGIYQQKAKELLKELE